jgi:GTP-binding protein EngB required for normal cell division
MTAGRPPWQILGSDAPEPEAADPVKPEPEPDGSATIWPSGAKPGSATPGSAKAGPVKTTPPVKAKPPWDLTGTAEPAAAEPATVRPPWDPSATAASATTGPVKARPPWDPSATAEVTTGEVTTGEVTTGEVTTAEVTTAEPAKARPPWELPATAEPATAAPSTGVPATPGPATAEPTTGAPATPRPATPWPATAEPTEPGPPGSGSPAGLPDRLTALSGLIQIASARTGAGGFSEDLLRSAEELANRAGERLRLSAGHTVVALAGGTGGGKSSLFNSLAGADFSTVGVTRPVTRDPHACVWGAAGSGPLLEWLGVPRRYRYNWGSELDGGQTSLNGLILLDLPDHDSVFGEASDQVNKLIGMADLMVWVLDPQKYADASVHQRYLVPLAGHSEVIAVVLNQADLLAPGDVEECAGDLRRLLDSEGLHNASLVVTSAVTGAGMDRLRNLLTQAVHERRASAARISADLDGIAAEFAPYAEQADAAPLGLGRAGAASGAPGGEAAEAGPAAGRVPAGVVTQLVDAFSRAAGISAVADALQSARELRALDYVGWPVAWLVERLTGRDPTRKTRLGHLWAEVKSMASGPSDAQQPEIDHALTRLADEIGSPLPKPWSQTNRAAARSQADQIPAALGTVMTESLPDENKIASSWRLIGGLQGLLLGGVVVSVAWILALLIFGVFGAGSNVPRLFSDASLLPWIVVLLGSFLLLGWLTAVGSRNVVRAAAEQESERVQETMRARIGAVAREMVITPLEQELAEFDRFRHEFRIVAGS